MLAQYLAQQVTGVLSFSISVIIKSFGKLIWSITKHTNSHAVSSHKYIIRDNAK